MLPANHLAPIAPYLYWFSASFFFLLFLPALSIKLIFKKKLSHYGLGIGKYKTGILIFILFYLVMLPILLIISQHPSFANHYPLCQNARKPLELFVVGYAIYFIGWEFIFRGYMLFGLFKRFGYYSIFIQTIPFALLHYGKPQLETISSLLAGIILGFLALRLKSVWYGILLHVAVAVSLDVILY